MTPPLTARWFGRRAVGFFGDQVILWNGCYWKRMPMEQDWTRVGKPRYSELTAVALHFRELLLAASILGFMISGVIAVLIDSGFLTGIESVFYVVSGLMVVFLMAGVVLVTLGGRFDD